MDLLMVTLKELMKICIPFLTFRHKEFGWNQLWEYQNSILNLFCRAWKLFFFQVSPYEQEQGFGHYIVLLLAFWRQDSGQSQASPPQLHPTLPPPHTLGLLGWETGWWAGASLLEPWDNGSQAQGRRQEVGAQRDSPRLGWETRPKSVIQDMATSKTLCCCLWSRAVKSSDLLLESQLMNVSSNFRGHLHWNAQLHIWL